ncbi:MAG: hypothetical protein ACT4TC_22400 [Myxococcaceae bacterium]
MTSVSMNTSISHSALVETAPLVEPLNMNVNVQTQSNSVEQMHSHQHSVSVQSGCTEIPEQPCTCEGWAKEDVNDEKKTEAPAGGGMNGLMGLLQMLADPLGLFKGVNMADPAGLMGGAGGAGGSPLGGQAKDQAQMLESVGSMASLAGNFF